MNVVIDVLIAIGTAQALFLPNSDNEIDSNEKDSFQNYEQKWFVQTLNHFDIQDSRTFLTRYVEDDTYFKPGGPLLLEIGGEGEINPQVIKQGQSYELAQQLHGKIIMLEHRYYGKSSPFKNLTASNLIYLTVDQALEDLANFVDTIKRTTPELKHSKVVAFGCSYSGSLATWFRYKYPHIIDAAWASSAPLRAVSDFYEYLEVAAEVYSNVSLGCYNTFRDGYNEARKLLSTPKGERQLKLALENWSCGNASEMNTSLILSNIRYVIADHNIPPDHGVSSCGLIQNANTSAIQSLILFLKVKSSDVCSDDEETYPNNEVAWSYQTCTEFGFSITMSSLKQPFNDSYSVIDEDMEMCSTDFGVQFNRNLLQKGIDQINRRYGSQNLKVTRVLSVHGAQDPWHKLGLYQQDNEEAPVIIVPGTSHCADQLLQDDEPPQLTEAKKTARSIIKKWVQ